MPLEILQETLSEAIPVLIVERLIEEHYKKKIIEEQIDKLCEIRYI